MTRKKILFVDDEEDIAELVRYNLTREGYHFSWAATGEQALESVKAKPVDLVLLDLMLPGVDGLEVARRLKGDAASREIPIIMLTAKGDESDIVTGLELGADDYVTKPFSPKILNARIRAVFRRQENNSPADSEVIRAHGLEINVYKHELLVRGEPVRLTYTEFQVLHLLAARPGWVFTRSQIVDAVRGDNYAVTNRSVDVQIVGLRKKLGGCANLIETVRGIGYRFKE